MKLIKINTDHYVIVDDSEIKEGDYLYSFSNNKVVVANKLTDLYVHSKKITYSTQPLNTKFNDWFDVQIVTLTLQEVKELFGEVDVEKKASELTNHLTFPEERKEGIILGYNQALEDNKDKKYTEEDLKRAFEAGHKKGFSGYPNTENWKELPFEKYIQSLQPKTEWNVEFVDGKLKLM